MLLTVDIIAKTLGTKKLFHDLHFSIKPHEKVAVIGRNGVGKTTLFNILASTDTDFSGTVQHKRGTRLVSTAQEHHAVMNELVLNYIMYNLPEYKQLKHILDTYPKTMGDNLKKIETYSNALARFSDLGYYTIEDGILRSLEGYQITPAMAAAPMARLSGGQKRFVELVRVEHANADIALIDEPTNHMDYAAKALFIDWLKATPQTVLVITHDRDVLRFVDKVIEIKNGKAHIFKGNYAAYLAQNTVSTAAKINDYQIGLKTLDNLHRQIMWARARKPSWHGTADQRNPFEVMERRLQKEYDAIKASLEKPSFWIDRESAQNLTKKVAQSYTKFKAKNIRINTSEADTHHRELLHIEDLQLGYDETALFKPVTFRLQRGERLRLAGRNGAGKTTLVRALMAASQHQPVDTLIAGTITCDRTLRLSVYEQELDVQLMSQSLSATIEHIYHEQGVKITDEMVKRIMSDYLFDPQADWHLTVGQLSGGQKARLQIIKMLAHNPNLLILDEPTNHLDLPSIEELENALTTYHGALLYVSHDSFFAKQVGGEQVALRMI